MVIDDDEQEESLAVLLVVVSTAAAVTLLVREGTLKETLEHEERRRISSLLLFRSSLEMLLNEHFLLVGLKVIDEVSVSTTGNVGVIFMLCGDGWSTKLLALEEN